MLVVDAVPVGAWIWPSEICDTPVTVLCALVEAERRRMARESVLTAMVCMESGCVDWDECDCLVLFPRALWWLWFFEILKRVFCCCATIPSK